MLLIAGSGMQHMAYYCATASKKISVINGCERGSSTTEIKKAVKPDMLDHLTKGFHVFLDNLTGDMFEYNKDMMEW